MQLSDISHACGQVLGGSCVLTNVNIPSTAQVNVPSHAIVQGRVTGGSMNYPAVGIAYVDGPTPSINIDGSPLQKGYARVVYYNGTAPEGTILNFEKDITYPSAGTYKLWGAAGYIDMQNNVFNVTDKREINVSVTAPTCEQYTTQSACEAAGCYWYNNSCHTNPPRCSDLLNEADCKRYNCYWYDNSCHDTPQPQPPTPDWKKYLPYLLIGGMVVVGAVIIARSK